MTAPGGEFDIPIRLLGISGQGILEVSYTQGTSFATPIVSGALALVLSLCPNIRTVSQFTDIFNVKSLNKEIMLDMRMLFADGVCSGIKDTCPLYKQQAAISNCTQCSSDQGYRPKCLAWNSATCEQCSIGKYFVRNFTTVSKCILCPLGTFSNTTGSSVCTACSLGTYAKNLGSTICTDCAACNQGYYTICYANAGWACAACPIGTYSNTTSIKVHGCQQCPAGSYANSTGFTACLSCQTCSTAGYYTEGCNATSGGECVRCTNI